jgi:hypothetical protein
MMHNLSSFNSVHIMQTERVTHLLQGVAEVRDWVVSRVPATDTMLGYDLFLKMGQDFFAGNALGLRSLAGQLPYAEDAIRGQVGKMVEAGLIVAQDAVLLPTKKFVELLENYYAKFESLFILRKDLRAKQLLVATDNAELRQLAESLYDHVFDLGWLYLHNFGSVCFLMASLVQRVAHAHGRQAHIESGYVEIVGNGNRFVLGGKGFAAPGQVEGHAMCVIDNALIVDFGVGNVRKGYRRDFYWGLACDYRPNDNVLGSATLPTGETVTWKSDWKSPDTDQELKKFVSAVDQLFQQYANQYARTELPLVRH